MEKICKNCEYWNFCRVTNDTDKYRPCTHKKVFIASPKTLHDSKKIIEGDLNSVILPSFNGDKYPLEPTEYIYTGANFGCVHFKPKNPIF